VCSEDKIRLFSDQHPKLGYKKLLVVTFRIEKESWIYFSPLWNLQWVLEVAGFSQSV